MPLWHELQAVPRSSCPVGAAAMAPLWHLEQVGAAASTASWCGLAPGAAVPVLTPWQERQVFPNPDAPRWTLASWVEAVVYEGWPLVLVEMWHVAVHPESCCHEDVTWPGL
jgi:hypothetical protein